MNLTNILFVYPGFFGTGPDLLAKSDNLYVDLCKYPPQGDDTLQEVIEKSRDCNLAYVFIPDDLSGLEIVEILCQAGKRVVVIGCEFNAESIRTLAIALGADFEPVGDDGAVSYFMDLIDYATQAV